MKYIVGTYKSILWTLLQIIIIAALFRAAWFMSFSSMDLNSVTSTSGTVAATSIQQNTSLKAVAGRMDLVIYLENKKTGYWLYRSSQYYKDIVSQLIKGKVIRIYHSKVPGASNYYTIYQIQTAKDIIYSKDEYELNKKIAGKFIVFPVAAILLLLFICRSYIKLFKQTPVNQL